MKFSNWIRLYIFIPLFLIAFILSFNFVIDPYSMTSYNLLGIKNKFARDDRKEKVAKLYVEPTYKNMLFGSSHVYSMNPLMAGKYLGGRSYNAGVGTARIEDHLGFLLFLKRINKLPDNILIGLDFYSFNQNVETNSYFLVNSDLNFLQKQVDSNLYFRKFLSLDAFRASYKTLRNFLINSGEKPRFDLFGAAGNASQVFTNYPKEIQHSVFSDEQIDEGYKIVKTIQYKVINKDRLKYVQEIVRLCHENKIHCTFFITPLSGQLLERIHKDPVLRSTLKSFKLQLANITSYYDFLTHNEITDNRFYFGSDALHTTIFTGNLILARLFEDKSIPIPMNFGVLRKQVEHQ